MDVTPYFIGLIAIFIGGFGSVSRRGFSKKKEDFVLILTDTTVIAKSLKNNNDPMIFSRKFSLLSSKDKVLILKKMKKKQRLESTLIFDSENITETSIDLDENYLKMIISNCSSGIFKPVVKLEDETNQEFLKKYISLLIEPFCRLKL